MRKLGICAAFLVASLPLTACQTFTAGESVSEPNPANAWKPADRAQAKHVSVPNDAVHAALGKPGSAPSGSAKEVMPPPAAAPAESATAAHILIRYAGTLRAPADVTRAKEEARKLADQVAAKARAPGADFAAIANEFTEDPSGKGTGGRLGTFPRGRMVPEFDKPLFELAPGAVSGVIETAFGFHIIKREK